MSLEQDIKIIKERYNDYSDYYVFALENLHKNGYRIMSIEEVAQKVFLAMEEVSSPKERVEDTYDLFKNLVIAAKGVIESIPLVQNWLSIMSYVAYDEMDWNSFHPGYFEGIEMYWKLYKKMLVQYHENGTEYGDDWFYEEFIDTATYIYSTPNYIVKKNIWNLPSLYDKKVYKSLKELEKKYQEG